MRKVKVLALLLAALMVVAVFAGCADTDAIVADVDSLEDRVTALEGLLNDQKDAIDDVKDQIGDVSDKLDDDTTADQLAATLEALKQLQEAMNAQNEQIKDLADKVTKVEEDAKESDENADDDAALEAAVKVYTAQLQELKIACELKKDLYILADYEAVVKALSDGIVAVAAAEKADDAKAAFETAKAVYDAKAIVSSKLAAFYAQVNNTITVDSKALIDEIRAYIYDDTTKTPAAKCPVTVKYGTSAATLTVAQNSELFVANIYGEKNPDGTAKLVNVVAELQKAVAAYDYIANANKANTFANKVKVAVDAIAAIKTVTYGTTSLAAATAAYEAVVADIVALDDNKDGVTDNKQYAPFLADSIMDQVTNAAELNAAKTRLVELAVAAAMYDTYVALATGTVGKIFDAYDAIVAKGEETLYTNKAKYDAVDALLNKWADAYKLEAVNVQNIVNDKKGDDDGVADDADYYYTYTLNKLTTELSVKAYTDFAAIANRIEALNNLTTVNAANVNEYGEITKAIQNWVVLQKASTAENATRLEKESIKLSDANIAKILEAYEIPVAVLTFSDGELTNMFALCDFANAEVKAFFKDNYSAIESQRKAINDKIKKLKTNIDSDSIKYSTIAEYLLLAGEYADEKVVDGTPVKDGVWEKITPSGTTTIAGFLETYKAYDLASLLNTADFDAALAKAIARIEGFKAGAANIKTLVEAIDYVEVIKTNDQKYATPTKAQLEARSYYCYVNLSDADAVAKANDAYAAWIKAGANTKMAEWVPAVDEDGEVIKDTFVFVEIADEITMNQLSQMARDINKLKDAAAKIVAHFELVAEIWNQNKAFALNATAEKNTDKVDVLTLVPAYLDGGVVNKVSYVYPVVVAAPEKALAAYSFEFNGAPVVLANKASAVVTTEFDPDTCATLQDLIDKGYEAYQKFLTMNANLTFKTSSNKLVVDKFAKVDDASVKAAIDGIADAELVMLKDHAKDTIMGSSMAASDKATFCGYVDTMVTDVAGNGSKLHNIALELSARFQLDMAELARGAAVDVIINDENKNDDTQKKNVKDYTQVFRVASDKYGNLDK